MNLSEDLIEQIPTERYSDGVLGGIGVAVQALLERVDAGVRPLDPENMITFNAGVLVGTSSPSACRTTIVSMNVLTGGYGSASAAGYFAPELKYAGFDSIFVSGKADHPIFLFISDGKAEILDASHLWGKTTWDTEDLIRQQFGDQSIQVLSIGPAGENLVSAANVMVCRNRSASRCGLGAIMGSKNLKAIAVRGKWHHSGRAAGKFCSLLRAAFRAPGVDKYRDHAAPLRNPGFVSAMERDRQSARQEFSDQPPDGKGRGQLHTGASRRKGHSEEFRLLFLFDPLHPA